MVADDIAVARAVERGELETEEHLTHGATERGEGGRIWAATSAE